VYSQLKVPWGLHGCQFYNSKDDLLQMLVPYFKQGWKKIKPAWLVGDLTVAEARGALAAVVPDLDRYMSSGQMQVRHYSELYTNSDGSVKSPDLLSDKFAEMELAVSANGFAGLRASGSVSWVKGEKSMTRFMDYETKVNARSRIPAIWPLI